MQFLVCVLAFANVAIATNVSPPAAPSPVVNPLSQSLPASIASQYADSLNSCSSSRLQHELSIILAQGQFGAIYSSVQVIYDSHKDTNMTLPARAQKADVLKLKTLVSDLLVTLKTSFDLIAKKAVDRAASVGVKATALYDSLILKSEQAEKNIIHKIHHDLAKEITLIKKTAAEKIIVAKQGLSKVDALAIPNLQDKAELEIKKLRIQIHLAQESLVAKLDRLALEHARALDAGLESKVSVFKRLSSQLEEAVKKAHSVLESVYHRKVKANVAVETHFIKSASYVQGLLVKRARELLKTTLAAQKKKRQHYH